jgi:hypothetical protein
MDPRTIRHVSGSSEAPVPLTPNTVMTGASHEGNCRDYRGRSGEGDERRAIIFRRIAKRLIWRISFFGTESGGEKYPPFDGYSALLSPPFRNRSAIGGSPSGVVPEI